MARVRMKPEDRRAVILEGAIKVYREHGFAGMRRRNVAAACAVPTSDETVKLYFKTMKAVKAAVADALGVKV